MQLTVQDVMTRSPLAVSTDATIDDVLQTLVSEGLTSVYVTTKENVLAGIVTDYELLKLQVLGGDRTQSVETLMSRSVQTIRPDENALAVCHRFRDGSLARMAVVDNDGRLVGNLTRRDVMRMMVAREQIACETGTVISERCGPSSCVPAPRSVQVARKALTTHCPQ
jgi:CBS-domain-containing membrane protein